MNRDTAEPQVDELPGERARERVDHHHQTAAPSTYVYEFVWDYTAPAEGPFCTDVDGNVLMDFAGHVGAAPLGYNNPELTERLAEFELVDPLKIAGHDFYAASGPVGDAPIPGPDDLMARLTDVSDGMDTVFLSNSGAEAVENAIKISYDHTDGKYAVTFEGAFHGRTLGALSLNRSKEIYRRSFPEISTVHDVPFCDDRTCDPATCSCGFFPAEDAPSQLRRMLDPKTGYVNPEEVAYVIVEPIQGEGGYRFPSGAFAEELGAVADERDLVLVADEIQSGMGRTGEFWAADHYPFEPDVIAAAKGLRVGATIAREEIFPDETGRLSSTWGGGDVVACAQGALTIDVIREQDLLANARERGRQFRETFGPTVDVVDVRGKGLMLAVEFDTKQRRDDVMAAAFQRGLLTLGCGRKTLRVLPPLDVTEREIELGCELLSNAVAAAT